MVLGRTSHFGLPTPGSSIHSSVSAKFAADSRLADGIEIVQRAPLGLEATEWRQDSGSGRHTNRRVTVEGQEIKIAGGCGAGVVKPLAGRTDPPATGIERL